MPRFPAGALRRWHPHPLARFVAWYVSSQMVFDSAIWILFLQHRGFSLAEIGLAEAAFHLAPVLLEIPSGSFADLVGRRWSLAIGSGLTVIAAALLWNASTLPVVMLALFVSGANYSFRSGADQAYLYDALSIEHQAGYGRFFGRLLSVGYLFGGAATWLGAFLSDWSYAWPYTMMGITGTCGVLLAVGLPEATRELAREIRRSPRQHIVDVRMLLRAQPAVAGVLVAAAVFWLTLTISGLYSQAVFAERGLSNGQIGLVIGSTWVAVAAGTALGGQMRGSFAWQWPWLTIGTGLGVALIGLDAIMVAIVAYLAREVLSGIVEPRLSEWYQQRLPPAQRATVLSVESWLFSCLMIGLFPLAGWFAERAGWPPLYIVCGAVAAMTALAGLLLRNDSDPSGDPPADLVAPAAPPLAREITS
ncbi:MAG: MFS transporter [Chloroflexota bacterium]|nr:MFS transporter [Chloroflexota bacterium]